MRSLALLFVLVACTGSEPDENPVVQSAAQSAECTAAERLVTDVCTELGPDDGCVAVDDVCVPLCDELTSCTVTGDLRATRGWPTAPDGYCVECVTP